MLNLELLLNNFANNKIISIIKDIPACPVTNNQISSSILVEIVSVIPSLSSFSSFFGEKGDIQRGSSSLYK